MRRLFSSILLISASLLAASSAMAQPAPERTAPTVSAPKQTPDSYTNGVKAFNHGDYQRAIDYLSGLGGIFPEYEMLSNYYIGASYVALKKLDKAKPFFKKNLEDLPTNNLEYKYMRSLSQLALARIAYAQFDDTAALSLYKRVLKEPEIQDSHKHALLEMASLYTAKGSHKKALNNLNSLISSLKGRKDALAAGALLERGGLLLKLNQFEGAQRDFETLMSDFQQTDKGLGDYRLAAEAGLARVGWEKKSAASRKLKDLNRERSANAKHLTALFSDIRAAQKNDGLTPDLSSDSGETKAAEPTENKEETRSSREDS